jgi:hypothetical protein
MELDAVSGESEYLAEFRRDIESFLTPEIINSSIGSSRPPMEKVTYTAFCDAADGSGKDSFASGIAHLEGQLIVCDAVLETKPPFVPSTAIKDHAQFLKSYGVKTVRADRYAKSYVREEFGKHNITVVPSEKDKSTIYGECLPLFNSHRVEIPNHQRLITQLLNLERRVRVGGKDLICEPPNSNDDLSNVACGSILAASEKLSGEKFRNAFVNQVSRNLHGLTVGTRARFVDDPNYATNTRPDTTARFENFCGARRGYAGNGYNDEGGSRPVKEAPWWFRDEDKKQ